MADEINSEALHLIMRNEGCVLHGYDDGGGVATGGYGHTGPDVVIGQQYTQEQADAWLEDDLTKFEDGVDDAIGGSDTTDNQYGAMVSLAYNIGLGLFPLAENRQPSHPDHPNGSGFRGSSVRRQHIAGNYAAAADAFLMWDKQHGRVLPGLVSRRNQERALYLKADVDTAVHALPQPVAMPQTPPPDNRIDLIGWLRDHFGHW